jgi:hypothetical protein
MEQNIKLRHRPPQIHLRNFCKTAKIIKWSKDSFSINNVEPMVILK